MNRPRLTSLVIGISLLSVATFFATRSSAQITATPRQLIRVNQSDGALTLVHHGSNLIRFSEATGRSEYFQVQPKSNGVGYVWKAFVDSNPPSAVGAERFQVSTSPSEFANFVRIDRTTGETWIATAVKGSGGSISEMRWEPAKP